MSAGGNVDWWSEAADSGIVAAPRQSALAVYTNTRGDVVVRQHDWPDDDAFIIVVPQNALALARAIIVAAGIDAEIAATSGRASDGAPKDRTAAERMRRHRDRNNDRNSAVTPTVTLNGSHRNGAPPLLALTQEENA